MLFNYLNYNCSPAMVKTKFLENLGIPKEQADQLYESGHKDYPLGRIGESEDIANGILYLASDEASFVTGINLVLDGGALYASS